MAAFCLLTFSQTTWADDNIFSNNYGDCTTTVWQLDLTTDAIMNQYAVPVSTLGGNNGRGVIEVGSILYLTTIDRICLAVHNGGGYSSGFTNGCFTALPASCVQLFRPILSRNRL
jgi:hypothetical protein